MQFQLFDDKRNEHAPKQLEGFRYQPELISAAVEAALLERVRELPFCEFEFHGYLGKRRVVSFGWKYDYSGGQLLEADEIPEFLLPLRTLVASFAEIEPEDLQQALVTEYRPGTGIGWHRDKAVFGQVVGVSLLAPCVLRFRRRIGENASLQAGRAKQWERVNVTTEPRSGYLLNGPARSEWEHSILRVGGLRYSITFRSLRKR